MPLLWAATIGLSAACASTPSTPSASSSTTSNGTGPEPDDPLAGVTGELVLTRQRDLIDRGLINALTINASDRDLYFTHYELKADFFEGTATEGTTASVRSGFRVALQVPYGTAVDCDSPEPVHAVLAVIVAANPTAPATTAELPLTGTDLLDGIRARQCATQAFAAAFDASLDPATIADGALVTSLTITRADQTDPTIAGPALRVERVNGTILVSTQAPAGALPLELPASEASLSIPVTFVVNRCDPHALAEVTKRFGLDLTISIDGNDPQPIAIPVDGLTTDLEAIVEQCRLQS